MTEKQKNLDDLVGKKIVFTIHEDICGEDCTRIGSGFLRKNYRQGFSEGEDELFLAEDEQSNASMSMKYIDKGDFFIINWWGEKPNAVRIGDKKSVKIDNDFYDKCSENFDTIFISDLIKNGRQISSYYIGKATFGMFKVVKTFDVTKGKFWNDVTYTFYAWINSEWHFVLSIKDDRPRDNESKLINTGLTILKYSY